MACWHPDVNQIATRTRKVHLKILNCCTAPPLALEWQVRRSLRWFDESDLQGLDLIRLEDELPELTEGAADWVKRVQAEGESSHVYGWYSPGKAEVPPYIMLYVRQVYRGIPSLLWWSSVPTLRLVRTLAHEVAHHVITTKGYVFQPGETAADEELIANRYAETVLAKMRAHWRYRFAHWCLRDLAGWHYAFGSVDWREKKYEAAADRFFKAWDLDPEHADASYWYWRAKEMCSKD